MSIYAWNLLGMVLALLVVLGGLLILYPGTQSMSSRRFFLYRLVTGAVLFFSMFAAMQLTREGSSQPVADVLRLLSPVALGVLALILVYLARFRDLRLVEKGLALLLGPVLAVLLVFLWREPTGLIQFTLHNVLLLAVVWYFGTRSGRVVFVQSLVCGVLRALLKSPLQ